MLHFPKSIVSNEIAVRHSETECKLTLTDAEELDALPGPAKSVATVGLALGAVV